MPPQSLPALQSGTPTAWEEAVYAFLVEKRARSGSTRTVESYARMLWPFFRVTTPDQVRSADVLAYAHGIGLSGRVPSSATVGARIACLSSFYRFVIRMGLVTANPCDALERPRTVPSVARGYSADEVRRLLAVVPDTVRGRRDRAILLDPRPHRPTTSRGDRPPGRRHQPRGRDRLLQLPGQGRQARPTGAPPTRLRGDLRDARRCRARTSRRWTPRSRSGRQERDRGGISSGTFYGRFRRYLAAAGLAPTGLHVLRHTAAKLRRDAGASVEAVSAFLDHSSLAVTTVYLRRLEGETDRTWPDVAVAIGV